MQNTVGCQVLGFVSSHNTLKILLSLTKLQSLTLYGMFKSLQSISCKKNALPVMLPPFSIYLEAA